MEKNLIKLLLLCGVTYAMAQQPAPQRPHFDGTYPDVHDPVMARGEDGRTYLFTTGMGISVLSSADGMNWRQELPVFSKEDIPQWAKDTVPGYHGHTWAPDISYHKGLWHLYYSCSTFGKNGSAIGLVTTPTLDVKSPDFKWTDQGVVIVSHQRRDRWNAIDPNLYWDENDTIPPYLVYGSFWDGIQLLPLDPNNLKTPTAAPRSIARRRPRQEGENAIEAPFIIHQGEYYYLLVSHDYCCKGQNSTYKTVYGRSRTIDGPYLDKEGRPMMEGGGTLLVGPTERFFGIGHCGAALIDGQWWFVAHAYDSEYGARPKLYLRKMSFDAEGWIILNKE